MTKIRTFIVRYFGPTNSRGSRVKIDDPLYRDVKFIPYENRLDALNQARAYLESRGVPIIFRSEGNGVDYLHSENLERRIK